jgi:hypothetical protein
VTLDTNIISFASCGAGGAPPPFPPLAVPTLPEIGKWILLVVLLGGGVYLVSRRTRATSSH